MASNKNSDRIYSSYTWEHFTVNHRLLVMTLSQQLTVSQNFGWLANLITSQCRTDDVCAAQVPRHSLAVWDSNTVVLEHLINKKFYKGSNSRAAVILRYDAFPSNRAQRFKAFMHYVLFELFV